MTASQTFPRPHFPDALLFIAQRWLIALRISLCRSQLGAIAFLLRFRRCHHALARSMNELVSLCACSQHERVANQQSYARSDSQALVRKESLLLAADWNHWPHCSLLPWSLLTLLNRAQDRISEGYQHPELRNGPHSLNIPIPPQSARFEYLRLRSFHPSNSLTTSSVLFAIEQANSHPPPPALARTGAGELTATKLGKKQAYLSAKRCHMHRVGRISPGSVLKRASGTVKGLDPGRDCSIIEWQW